MPEEKDTVQASITEIAKFVKQKTEELNAKIEKMKEELQARVNEASSDEYSKSLAEFEEKLKKYAQNSRAELKKELYEHVEEKIEELRKAQPDDKTHKKVEEFESRVKRDLHRIENSINASVSSAVEQNINSYLERTGDIRSELKNEMVGARRDLMTQMRYLERSVSDLKTDLRSLDTRSVEAKIAALEGKLADTQGTKARMNDLEKQILDLKSAISSKVLKAGTEDEAMVEAHVKRIDELETKLNELGKAGSRGTNSIMLTRLKSEIMEYVDGTKNDTNEKLRSIEDTLSETKISAMAAQQGLHDEGAAHRIDALGKGLEELKTRFAHQDSTHKIEALNKELNELKKSVVYIASKRVHDEQAAHEIDTLNRDMDELKKGLEHEENSLRRKMDELKKGLEHEDAMHSVDELNKKMGSLKKSFENVSSKLGHEEEDAAHKIEALGNELKSMKSHTEELDKQIKQINEQYAKFSNGPESYEELMDDVLELKRNTDEESSLRISTDKTVQEMEKKVNELNASYAKIKDMEKLDYSKVLESLQSNKVVSQEIEENVKLEAMKIITKQLEEFAKTLDKKLPNIATRDELARIEAKVDQRIDSKIEQRLDQKMRTVRQQTAMPMLDKRMEALEKSVRDLLHILKTSARQQQPYIVE